MAKAFKMELFILLFGCCLLQPFVAGDALISVQALDPSSELQAEGYTHRIGDCVGNDIRKITKTTVADCARECNASESCKSFLYNSRSFSGRYCWLKSSECPRLTWEGMSHYHFYTKAAPVPTTETGKEETAIGLSDCLRSDNCWVKYDFSAPSTWNDCAGGAKYVKKTNYTEGKLVGVELCSPTKYKLFLANNLTSEFKHIADGAGIGDDHCEFMGGDRNNAKASKEGAEYAPRTEGFRRSYWGSPVVRGLIGRENGHWYYPKSYTCGVTVPGSAVVVLYGGPPGEALATSSTTPATTVVSNTTSTLVAPRITLAPQDQKAENGGTVSFVCQAFGSPVPDIVWLRNEQRVTTRARYRIHDIPFGSVLRIEPVKAETDNATISCVAQNGIGVPARVPANLQVYPRAPSGFPTITTNPSLKAVEKDRTTVMVCGATGNPAPTLKWLKDYRPVNLSDPRLTLLSSGSLQIEKSQETDEGRYECLAENDVGVTYSYPASLYVRVRRSPPYLTTPPENTEVLLGGSVNLTCIAAGSPEPYVKWRKEAEELTPEDSIPIKENVLMLTNVREPANYTCIATNMLGRTSAVAQVKVKDEVPVVNATETSYSVSDCLNSGNCWVRYNFSAPSTWNDCAGGAKYVKKTNYSEGRFLGVELCSPTKYKLFLANNLTSDFEHIADGAGFGEDHCEFVGGLQSDASVSSEAGHAPNAIGFRRSHWGRPLVHGKIGRMNGYWFYPRSYTCGVTVPGSDRVTEYDGSLGESSPAPATNKPTETETIFSVKDCLSSTDCWVRYNFSAPVTWNDCAGGAKYVKKTHYSEGKFVGVELCSPTKYKLFLANNLTSEYQHIADGAGIGDDHCEFVGGEKGNANATKEGAEHAPRAIGFRRGYWGGTLTHGKIGRANGFWYYPKSYTCGVTVPGSNRVTDYDGSPGESAPAPAKPTETETTDSVKNCLSSRSCWVSYNFSAPSTWNDCAGGAKYVKKTNYSEGKFVGVELCSPTKYKLFLANNLTSEYQHIADGAGIGDDHCEFVGGEKGNANATKDGAEHAPSAIGFRRSHWGSPVAHGKIGRANGYWYYPKSYTCGVTVPGSDRVVEYDDSASETFVTPTTTPTSPMGTKTTSTPAPDFNNLEGYSHRNGDCPGYDINRVARTTVDVCAEKCREMTRCKSFMFYDRGILSYCWLKYNECGTLSRTSERNLHFYNKMSQIPTLPSSELPEALASCRMKKVESATIRDVGMSAEPTSSEGLCGDKCHQNTMCDSAIFDKDNNKCLLHLRRGFILPRLSRDSCCATYKKVCPLIKSPVPPPKVQILCPLDQGFRKPSDKYAYKVLRLRDNFDRGEYSCRTDDLCAGFSFEVWNGERVDFTYYYDTTPEPGAPYFNSTGIKNCTSGPACRHVKAVFGETLTNISPHRRETTVETKAECLAFCERDPGGCSAATYRQQNNECWLYRFPKKDFEYQLEPSDGRETTWIRDPNVCATRGGE